MLRKILLIALAAPLFADDFSFTGNFTSDDNAAYFVFTLGSSSSVTLRTLGYAGGVNAVGTTIGRGGGDPILSLFAGTGPNALLIGLNNDGTCGDVGQDSVTSACWDSYLSMPGLVAGTYTVVLTQSDNSPFGPFLGDGFARTGQGNFTGPTFLNAPGSFIDAGLSQRTSDYALDILNVRSAAESAVPEPSTLLLLSSGLLGLAGWRKRCRLP